MSDPSLQRRFPIDEILLRSGDNRDQVAKLSEIARENWCSDALSEKFRQNGFLVLMSFRGLFKNLIWMSANVSLWLNFVQIGSKTAEEVDQEKTQHKL